MRFESTLRAPTRHCDAVSNCVRVSCSLAFHNVSGLHETSTDWIFRLRFVSLKGDTISHNLVERTFAMALAAIFWKLEGVSPEPAATPALSNKMISRPLAKPSVAAGSQWFRRP
jgi:hypothetical protein